MSEYLIVISTTLSRLSQAKAVAEKAYSSIKTSSLIICQTYEQPDNMYENISQETCQIVFSSDRGIAKSRMLGLLTCTANYLWFLDDDVNVEHDNAMKAFSFLHEHPDIDFVTTQFGFSKEVLSKRYPYEKRKHTLFSILRASSIEIFVNRELVLSKGVGFDTRFGLGAEFKSGEENIFLRDILWQGGRGEFLPITTSIHPMVTSGQDIESLESAKSKGALFKRMFGFMGYFILILFYLKKSSERKITFRKAVSCIYYGVKASWGFR